MSVLELTAPAGGSRERAEAPAAAIANLAKLDWLDALKGIAILAVVFDHAFIVDDYLLWKHSYFAVSWFIFLAGVSNTVSARRRDYRPPTGTLVLWRRRLSTILAPYLWASFLAYAVLNFRRFSAAALLHELLLFHALPPLYFVALLLQLLAVFPLLYWALYGGGWGARAVALGCTVLSGAWLSHVITFPWVLGAHYFLGASFLYLFVVGMLAAPLLTNQRLPIWVWPLLCLPLLYWAEGVVVRSNGLVMTHPPSNVLVVYAVASLGVAYALVRAAPHLWPSRVLTFCGRHSLDIFLYHYLFLIPFLQFRHEAWTDRLGFVQGQVVLMLVAIPLAIAASLLTARCSGWLGGRTLRLLRTVRRTRRGILCERFLPGVPSVRTNLTLQQSDRNAQPPPRTHDRRKGPRSLPR